MSKQSEIDYLSRIGPEGTSHALNKPFSDPGCGQMLVDIGIMLQLLPPPPCRLLDLGCGSGWTSVVFAQRGYEVVGQDLAPDMIAIAEINKQRAQVTNLRFVVADYEDMRFHSEFECAVFFDSLHHAVDEELALRGVYRALVPGGVLLTHEPGEGHSASAIAQTASATFGVTEKDLPPNYLVTLARRVGFREQKIMVNSERLVRLGFGLETKSRLATLSRYRMLQPLVMAAIYFRKWGRVGSMVRMVK